MSKNLTPAVRFNGFTDDWEQRRLGELESDGVISMGRGEVISATDMKMSPGNYPVYSSSAQNNGKMGQYGKYMFDRELITWSIDGGGSVFFRKKHKFSVTNVCGYIACTSQINTAFLAYQMKKIHEGYRFNYVTKAHPSVIRTLYRLGIPRLNEQQQIGSVFNTLDTLVALRQRKLELLQQLKKAMLQQMFPDKGSNIPQLRFRGFNDAWEQRKVSEIFRVTRGYVLASTQIAAKRTNENLYPVYSSQTKNKGLMGYYKDYLYEDAITWTTDGANAGTVNYRTGKFYCTNVCGVLLSDEVKADQMTAEALNSVAKKYVSYVGNPKLMNNVMADITIQIPAQEVERKLLSSLFLNLDNLITLHQHELERFEKLKKFLLQQMFV